MMERQDILATMGELKLFGMKAAYDEIIKVALKRTHEPQQVVGDLLQAEISEKQARSIRYQMTIAKLPLAKDIAEFDFSGTPINEILVRDLAPVGMCHVGLNTQLQYRVVVGGNTYLTDPVTLR